MKLSSLANMLQQQRQQEDIIQVSNSLNVLQATSTVHCRYQVYTELNYIIGYAIK